MIWIALGLGFLVIIFFAYKKYKQSAKMRFINLLQKGYIGQRKDEIHEIITKRPIRLFDEFKLEQLDVSTYYSGNRKTFYSFFFENGNCVGCFIISGETPYDLNFLFGKQVLSALELPFLTKVPSSGFYNSFELFSIYKSQALASYDDIEIFENGESIVLFKSVPSLVSNKGNTILLICSDQKLSVILNGIYHERIFLESLEVFAN